MRRAVGHGSEIIQRPVVLVSNAARSPPFNPLVWGLETIDPPLEEVLNGIIRRTIRHYWGLEGLMI